MKTQLNSCSARLCLVYLFNKSYLREVAWLRVLPLVPFDLITAKKQLNFLKKVEPYIGRKSLDSGHPWMNSPLWHLNLHKGCRIFLVHSSKVPLTMSQQTLRTGCHKSMRLPITVDSTMSGPSRSNVSEC